MFEIYGMLVSRSAQVRMFYTISFVSKHHTLAHTSNTLPVSEVTLPKALSVFDHYSTSIVGSNSGRSTVVGPCRRVKCNEASTVI